MKQWVDRTPAIADLLNPALVAVALAAAATEYERRRGEPMPFALAFIVAPLVLHRGMREELPNRVDSHLARWVMTHEVFAASFGSLARSLVDPVREGLRFGVRASLLSFLDGGIVGTVTSKRPANIGDIRSIYAKAGFVGRWLTQQDSPATVYAVLGVEP